MSAVDNQIKNESLTKACCEEEQVEDFGVLRTRLLNPSIPIRQRMDALFKLRTIASLEAVKALEETLITEPSSDLLRHEVCYCLGQMTNSEENKLEITNFLYKEVFENPKKYEPIVLHEAAEALGNISSENNLTLLEKFLDYDEEIIKETCEISVENINWIKATNDGETEGLNKLKLIYHTNDPAPPFNFKTNPLYSDIQSIRKIMHDEKDTLYNRYRALFTLREFNNDEAVSILCECFDKNFSHKFSPLFKHEVSFILGQMCQQAKSALKQLEIVLQDESEDPIVRHETALTLGEITECTDLLTKYTKHENQLVRESCEVALDFVDYWHGGCC
jgi:deoxyhypusine monooxygenase